MKIYMNQRESQTEHNAYTDSLRRDGLEAILLGDPQDGRHRETAARQPNLHYTIDVCSVSSLGTLLLWMTYPILRGD